MIDRHLRWMKRRFGYTGGFIFLCFEQLLVWLIIFGVFAFLWADREKLPMAIGLIAGAWFFFSVGQWFAIVRRE